MQRIAVGSIGVGLGVFTLRTAAWWVTGSAALFSDAAESVVNVVSAVLALFALRLSAKPADDDHPYGHSKIEFISAVIEGVLILLAAFAILHHAWDTYLHPTDIEAPLAGILLNGASTVLNGLWAMLLLRTGKRMRSPALVGDGRHLMSDVVNSTGLVIGLGLAVVTGMRWLDPVLAVMAAIYILGSGTFLIRDSVSGLMDAAPGPEVVERVRRLVSAHAEGALEAHDLKMRHSGPTTFLDFHLVVPGSMTVEQAHHICDRVEQALKDEMEGMVISIHVEPEGKAKHEGVLVL